MVRRVLDGKTDVCNVSESANEQSESVNEHVSESVNGQSESVNERASRLMNENMGKVRVQV
jgi:hypothetical protein